MVGTQRVAVSAQAAIYQQTHDFSCTFWEPDPLSIEAKHEAARLVRILGVPAEGLRERSSSRQRLHDYLASQTKLSEKRQRPPWGPWNVFSYQACHPLAIHVNKCGQSSVRALAKIGGAHLHLA